LTLPFDIRDRSLDDEQQVKTFGTSLSLINLKRLQFLTITGGLMMVALLHRLDLYDAHTAALLSFVYICIWMMSRTVSPLTDEMYYLGVLDSLILCNGAVHLI
ncbi:MAG: hypothetical protein AAFR14_08690, partial [Bacteroidota bacterium]